MEETKTKICRKCGRELPLEMFGKGSGKDGRRTICKECTNAYLRESRRRRTLGIGDTPNPDLARFTPQELITELRARGYEGYLSFTETKVHKIRV